MLAVLIVVDEAGSHQAHKHAAPESAKGAGRQDASLQILLGQINSDYQATVKPIFLNSCLDCHSTRTRYPWYAKLPGARHLIEHDVAEAKKHLDMSRDFPFQGHGAPEEDLKAIVDAVNERSMPPLRYRFLHPASALTDEDVSTIGKWAERGLRRLKNAGR